MYTPWGESQTRETVVSDPSGNIICVTTASHGGYFIPPKYQEKIPAYCRKSNGWYEEDCEWCIPFVFILAIRDGEWCKKNYSQKIAYSALDTFREWYPDMYEKFYKIEIPEGLSRVKDERLFNEKHKGDYIVVCAGGIKQEKVPSGMVLTLAKIGGRENRGGEEQYFLVPDAEYAARSSFGFVIDTDKHHKYVA